MIYKRYNNYNEETSLFPYTIQTSGEDIEKYTVYGKTVENLFNKNATDTNNGYSANHYINSNGSLASSNNYNVSEYIPVTAGNYFISFAETTASNPCLAIYDVNKTLIETIPYSGKGKQFTFSVVNNATSVVVNNTFFIRISYKISYIDSAYLITGTLPLETYISYGNSESAGCRTNSLVYKLLKNANIDSNGIVSSNDTYDLALVPVTANATYSVRKSTSTSNCRKK